MEKFAVAFRPMSGIVDALVQAAKDAREEHGVSKERVADELGKSLDTIKRFESGGAFLALNDLMAAYSATTGVSLFDLLDDAKSHLKKKG